MDDSSRSAPVLSTIGYLLGISYPLLAFSATGRSVYQLFFKAELATTVGPLTSLFAACCYLAATIGFAYRRPWTWWLSLCVLGIESFGTLVTGFLSILQPELIGSSVWRLFGIDFAFLPLVQPIAGMVWLAWRPTRKLFGIGPPSVSRPLSTA